MVFFVIVATIFAGYGTAYLASDDVRYITRAGFEETRILKSRQPISRMVRDASVKPAVRRSLSLVLQARDYAARLGLEAKETYTTYADVGRDTLLLVLQASPKDCICPHTWKYPIVGRIPYKGFFDTDAAHRETARFDARGYDTYLRPSAAFSTLGWFNDPLLSTALSRDSAELVATVFHEIAHNTLYVKSATPFNESFANMVGYRVAEAFFRDLGDSTLAQHAANRWHDEIALGEYYASLVARLEALYAGKPDSTALEAGRREAAAWARSQLQGPFGTRLRTISIDRLIKHPINNAQLIGARIYRTRLNLFQRWYEQHDRDIGASVRSLKTLMAGVEGDSAYVRLERAVGGQDSRTLPPGN